MWQAMRRFAIAEGSAAQNDAAHKDFKAAHDELVRAEHEYYDTVELGVYTLKRKV